MSISIILHEGRLPSIDMTKPEVRPSQGMSPALRQSDRLKALAQANIPVAPGGKLGKYAPPVTSENSVTGAA